MQSQLQTQQLLESQKQYMNLMHLAPPYQNPLFVNPMFPGSSYLGMNLPQQNVWLQQMQQMQLL